MITHLFIFDRISKNSQVLSYKNMYDKFLRWTNCLHLELKLSYEYNSGREY